MPSSIASGDFLTLNEACNHVPGRPHVNTLRRWCDRGFDGVILKSWRCGHRRLTTLGAINDFISAMTANDASCAPLPTAGHRHAEQQLDDLGVK
ncbi:MAG: DUF1580 domain-containing protein [Planctomycetes bacterium]|nr:DUF1580 domain-containing protein [Planctomycetota bacterium]